ncbi:MAG: hypothetical protein JXQ67_06905 [Campylobacterales bacterium]|nr:hypothetical protein [Campylobacterales bacterium]
MWRKSLELAIIEKDVAKMEELLQTIPEFTTLEEMQRAQALLRESVKLLEALKSETLSTMKRIKQNSDFLKVSQEKEFGRLDIRS